MEKFRRMAAGIQTSLAALALAGLLAERPAQAQTPLTLDDVLQSVERNYPPLLVALLEPTIADAALLQAQGRFDLQMNANVGSNRFGFYETERLGLGLEQAFTSSGVSVYSGWNLGNGSFAAYEGKDATRSGGEWVGGVKIPLSRNRQIDERRAGLRRATLGQDLADLGVDQQRLVIRQLASRRYWEWVSAGQRLGVAQRILSVAEERDQQLRTTADLGQIPAIEVTENQRQILQRQAQLAEAQRGLQQTAFALSLFYRDAAGDPLLPDESQLPPSLPATNDLQDEQLMFDLNYALKNRPDLLQFDPLWQQTALELDLAENERRPAVDLGLGFASQAGSGGVARGPQEFKATLSFNLPFQRRVADGKIAAAEAKLRQLKRRAQFLRDQITAEVRDAASALRVAHQRALLAAQEVRVALDLADAERVRFDLGDSTLFTVNLREQAAVDAELREIAAINDYLQALTIYEQVTAQMFRQP